MPWVQFFSYIFSTALTPGPNNVMSMNLCQSCGWRKAFMYSFGATSGFFVLMTLAGFLNLMLAALIPQIQPYLLWLGVAYMLYLAYKTLFPKKHAADAEPQSGGRLFVLGVFLQLANVKGILYGLVAMGVYIVPHFSEPYQILLFSAFLCLVSLTTNTLWILFGMAFQKLFSKYPVVSRLVMASLLLYCAVTLMISAFSA